MGFPSVSLKMPCLGINFLVALLTYFKIVLIVALTQLRLLKPLQQCYTSEDDTINYVLVINPLCPTPVPVPVNTLTAIINKRLPVANFSSILSRLGKHEDEVCVCSVCLDSINKSDETRELYNCCHVFHRGCLDNWVDEGQVTCPLCRSLLFPDNVLTSKSEDPWIPQSRRNAIFSGGDPPVAGGNWLLLRVSFRSMGGVESKMTPAISSTKQKHRTN